MKLALDTNRYRDFCAGDGDVLKTIQSARQIVIPFPVVAELRAGFAAGTLTRKNEQVLALFLNRPRVHVVYPDDQTIFHYARLYQQLRVQGTPIPVHDLWIAALVEQHGLMLYSRDAHFDRLPQLARIQ
jgi:tRNA(fMet)-specific endonuclease VapC